MPDERRPLAHQFGKINLAGNFPSNLLRPFLNRKLYFDSNIFSRIARKGELEEVCDWIQSNAAAVIFPDAAIAEMDRIPDLQVRRERYLSVGRICTFLDDWIIELVAQEFIGEVRRCRPEWLTPLVSTSSRLEGVKEGRRVVFDDLRHGSTDAVEQRAQVAQRHHWLKDETKGVQKNSQRKEFDGIVFDKVTGKEVRRWPIDNFEDKWRIDFMITWWQSVGERLAGGLDFQICTDHVIASDALRSTKEFDIFCFSEVKAENVPLNILRATIWEAQLEQRIKASNAGDNLHAVHLFKTDLFFTADKPFYDLLIDARNLVSFPAKIIFVDRDEGRTVDYLQAAWTNAAS